MDINKLIERVKNVLLSPKTEWPVIAQEHTDVATLYTGYAMILAAIPAVFGFLGSVVFAPGSIGILFVVMILQYAIAIGLTFALALIVDALAPTFGAQKSTIQAHKTVVYASTASWVAGVFLLIPFLGWIIALAGSIYSLVQLYLALPCTMKSPPEKTGGYFAVVLVIAIVLSFVTGFIISAIMIGAAISTMAVS
ncbi:MAG: YIP1 family protein [Rhodanobacteraceae bacterium]|nr:YIP1 family protein [Rhodanobacteraceae bacterium]